MNRFLRRERRPKNPLELHQRLMIGGGPAIPAPVFRSAASNSTNSATELVVSVPAGTTDGDAMLAFGTFVNLGSGLDVPTPSGWTALGSVVQGSVEVWAWRRVASSEPANYTFKGAAEGPSTAMAVAILSFSGTYAANFMDVAFQSETEAVSGTSYSAPGVTTTVNNATMVSAIGLDSSPGFTAPGGMTERADVNSTAPVSNSGCCITVASVDVAAAGATGAKTFTAGSTDGTGGSISVAIKRTA